MKWSWKIARVAGIDVFMHSTFLLLVAWIAISSWLGTQSVPAVVSSLLFLLALFGSVVLHEYGHALTARRFGIQTRDITLLPIGGVARLERMPEKPIQELWVALMGPAVNVIIVIVLSLILLVTGQFNPANLLDMGSDAGFLNRLIAVNISLALFNLLPAFPMDGGRVLRALLATRMEYTRATALAASVGQGLALLLGFFGLFNNPFLLFIAFFVWIGAAQEASMVQMKSALSGIPVSRAMLTDFRYLAPTDPLSNAVNYILSGTQQDFPVVADGKVVGILTRDDVIRALAEQNESTFVSYIMRKDFQVIDSSQMLEGAAQVIQTSTADSGSQGILPVVHNGTLVGLLTMENIGEFLMIQRALRARQAARTMS